MEGWRGGGVGWVEGWRAVEGWRGEGGVDGVDVDRTEPSARNTAQYMPQHTAARQYRTVPILNSHDGCRGCDENHCCFSSAACQLV